MNDGTIAGIVCAIFFGSLALIAITVCALLACQRGVEALEKRCRREKQRRQERAVAVLSA